MPASVRSDTSSQAMTERHSSIAEPAPRAPGQNLTVPGQANGHTSQFQSIFSSSRNGPAQPSPTGADLIDEKQITKHLKKSSQGDVVPALSVPRSHEETQQSRRKSSFYGDVFAYRESYTSVKDRIARESVVVAEVKTNVIVCFNSLSDYRHVNPWLIYYVSLDQR